MMKLSLIIIVLCFVSSLSIGQELVKHESFYGNKIQNPQKEDTIRSLQENNSVELQTLFSNHNWGAYAAFSNGFGDIDGDIAFVTGGRLMFVNNHTFSIGFGGKAFVTKPDKIRYSGNNSEITSLYTMKSGAYAGLYLEPVIGSMKPIHLSVPILLGVGAIVQSQWDNTSFEDNYDDHYNNNNNNESIGNIFLVAEPGIELEFNIAKWFRISLGSSYRFTSNIEHINENLNTSVDGFNYELSFKVGWF